MSSAIILFAHGSRIESANQTVRKAASDLARAGEFPTVEAAFLELGQPDLPSAAAALVARGITQITVIPYFLTLGTHLERDLPRLVHGIEVAHPGVEIRVTPPLDGHPALVQALLDRAREAHPFDLTGC
jgi:sirohydrochlorin ferrochelatase